jgi:hypothetical protein
MDFARRTGLVDLIGEEHFLPTLDLAVQKAESVPDPPQSL